jgi:polyisoprenoid-binding protein YceI
MRRTLTAIALTAALAGAAPAALAAAPTATSPLGIASATPSMEWSAVTTMGGGWVTGMVTGPTGEVYSRTDVGGAYRWDEAASSGTR